MEINGLGHIDNAHAIRPTQRTEAIESTRQADSVMRADEVDISPEADFVAQIHELPDVRADRVAEIRPQIEAGAYETDDKLDVAIGRLLDEIG